MWILTVTADGALPLAYRLADGNTSDDQTHITTWDHLRALTGRHDFLYVADCKLCTHAQMTHIDRQDGRFVTVLPRSRKEDGLLRDWVQTHQPPWSEADRRPGKRKQDPEEVWDTAPAPFPSAEGYRIVWVRSSSKVVRDADARQQRIERSLRVLTALNERLQGPKSRLRTRHAVEEAATAALSGAGGERWITYQVNESTHEHFTQEKRGRPGENTRYRRHTRTIFAVAFAVNAEQVIYDAHTDGCFPLITNTSTQGLADAQVLAAYRYQPNLEQRHHQLKSVQDAAPVFLKNAERIEGLFLCHYVALLCCALIERELRHAMARQNIPQLPLYPESRACKAPTAARALELFAGLTRHHLTHDAQHIQTFAPELTPLQTQILDLLGVPATAYDS